jgi:2-keto-4-pentenoate hydratase/2-oxohepta-3-ene-1,7-dioic acid hydratase in catechol pathway
MTMRGTPCLKNWPDPIDVTEQHLAAARAAAPLGEHPSQFLVPLDPGKVIGVGLNYRCHAIEVNVPIPRNPLMFAKFNTALIGHGDTIVVDEAVTKAADWEVELAVIVGQTLHRASRGLAPSVRIPLARWVRGSFLRPPPIREMPGSALA